MRRRAPGRDRAYRSAYVRKVLSPALARFGLAAHQGNTALFDAYAHQFEKAKIPIARKQYLSALGAFSDPALQEKALRYAVGGTLRANEYFYSASRIQCVADRGPR